MTKKTSLTRVALYMRVSTIQQKIDSQRKGLLEYVQNHGYKITKEYIDIGLSGAHKDRPELVNLLKDAQIRKFDIVLVWKFDRFARSVSHLLEALEQFDHLDIGFISVTDHVDTKSPQGKAMFGMLAVLAELERDIHKERIIAGMENAKNNGVILGRPLTSEAKIKEIQDLAEETEMSINAIHESVGIEDISRSVVGKLVKTQRDKKS